MKVKKLEFKEPDSITIIANYVAHGMFGTYYIHYGISAYTATYHGYNGTDIGYSSLGGVGDLEEIKSYAQRVEQMLFDKICKPFLEVENE